MDDEAFEMTHDNKPRSKAAHRKEKSRAVGSIRDAVKSAGNQKQQALALRDAYAHPEMRAAAKTS